MASIYQPDRTRQRILEAAFQEVYRNGFRATSLKRILAETGLTKGALYHHFASKQALGHALIDEFFPGAVAAVFLDPLAAFDDPIEGLLRVIGNAFAALDDEEVRTGCPVNNLALEMAPLDPAFQQRLEKIYTTWSSGFAGALRRGQKEGLVSTEVDPDDAGAFIVAALAGCRGIAKSTQSRQRMVACQRGLEMYIRGLRP